MHHFMGEPEISVAVPLLHGHTVTGANGQPFGREHRLPAGRVAPRSQAAHRGGQFFERHRDVQFVAGRMKGDEGNEVQGCVSLFGLVRFGVDTAVPGDQAITAAATWLAGLW